MQFFVTDAQLAALRVEVYEQARDACQGTLERQRAAHDAEIQRLREDREKELGRMTDPQGPLVAHYRDEVTFWRRQFLSERQRADIAMDQCRVTHQAIGPVTMPPREDRLPREMQGAFGSEAEAELAAMGRVDVP